MMSIRHSLGGLLLALLLSACSAAIPVAPTVVVEPTSSTVGNLPQTEAEVPRVTVEQALTAVNGGEAILVDVRITESFTAGHIQGALSIPLADIEAKPLGVKLDKSRWIITYCT